MAIFAYYYLNWDFFLFASLNECWIYSSDLHFIYPFKSCSLIPHSTLKSTENKYKHIKDSKTSVSVIERPCQIGTDSYFPPIWTPVMPFHKKKRQKQSGNDWSLSFLFHNAMPRASIPFQVSILSRRAAAKNSVNFGVGNRSSFVLGRQVSVSDAATARKGADLRPRRRRQGVTAEGRGRRRLEGHLRWRRCGGRGRRGGDGGVLSSPFRNDAGSGWEGDPLDVRLDELQCFARRRHRDSLDRWVLLIWRLKKEFFFVFSPLFVK